MIKYNLMIMLIVGKNKNNKTSTFLFALIIVIIKRFFKNIELFLPNFQFGRKNELFMQQVLSFEYLLKNRFRKPCKVEIFTS